MMARAVAFRIMAVTLSALLTGVIVVAGFFGYRKLTFSYEYCESYGAFDDELGWRLRPNASSCIALRNRATGTVYFDSRIYTNADGFRSASAGGPSATQAVLALGDSWTFGYGVNYEDAYPALLSTAIQHPVINMGIPAYGSGGTLLLFRRHVEHLAPTAVILLTGMHERSLCTAEAVPATLVPCFYWDPASARVVLGTPQPGAVTRAVAAHRYPAGSLTAGYDSWLSFAFLVKPRLILNSLLEDRTKTTDTDHLLDIFAYELAQYQALSEAYGFVFVLIDKGPLYRDAVLKTKAQWANRLIYIGPEQWTDQFATPMNALPADEALVPGDGHYGRGSNQIIATALARILQQHRLTLNQHSVSSP